MKRGIAVLATAALLAVVAPQGHGTAMALDPGEVIRRAVVILGGAGNYFLCVAVKYVKGTKEPCLLFPAS